GWRLMGRARPGSFVGVGGNRVWLVLPAVIFLAVVYLYSLGRMALISVDAPDISLANYRDFFSNPVNLAITLNTFKTALLTTLLCLILGYPVAYLLVQISAKRRRMLLLLVIIPYLTSFLVRTYAWVVILNERGIVNQFLMKVGLVTHPLKLVFNSLGVQVGMVHVMLPMMILPLYAVMN